MKVKNFGLLVALAMVLSGCIHFPGTEKEVPAIKHVQHSLPPTPNVTVTAPAAKNAGPARKAVQTTVNWFATLAIFAGLAATGWGAFKVYSAPGLSGKLAGARWILYGLLTPIVAIWFAFHWELVVGIVAAVFTVYAVIHYHLLSKVRPAVQEISDEVSSLATVPGGPQPHTTVI